MKLFTRNFKFVWDAAQRKMRSNWKHRSEPILLLRATMANGNTSSDSNTTYDRQVHACKKFFVDDLSKGPFHPSTGSEIPHILKKLRGEVFDIRGWDAHRVIGLLSDIINKWEKDQIFDLIIKDNSQGMGYHVFEFKANPTSNQPGNGVVCKYPSFPKAYRVVNRDLKLQTTPEQFSHDMKKLFLKNEDINGVPEATVEAYVLLLFEIARILVRPSDEDSEEKRKLYTLPIGVSIMRIVELFEKKVTSFDEVFRGKFYCFGGRADARKKAIDEINKLYRVSFEGNVTDYQGELKEMFRKPESGNAAHDLAAQ